jgi:hypothetical protein
MSAVLEVPPSACEHLDVLRCARDERLLHDSEHRKMVRWVSGRGVVLPRELYALVPLQFEAALTDGVLGIRVVHHDARILLVAKRAPASASDKVDRRSS